MTPDLELAGILHRPAWIDDLFACIDHRDAAGFAQFMTPDGRFRFGNAPAVVGREAIEAAVAGFFEAIGGVTHQLTLTADLKSYLVCRGEATYTRLDGSTITVPFANVFEMVGAQVHDYQIYADLTPLWNPAAA